MIVPLVERVNIWSSKFSNNIFRQTNPYICDSIAKGIFSEIIMAAKINYYNKIPSCTRLK